MNAFKTPKLYLFLILLFSSVLHAQFGNDNNTFSQSENSSHNVSKNENQNIFDSSKDAFTEDDVIAMKPSGVGGPGEDPAPIDMYTSSLLIFGLGLIYFKSKKKAMKTLSK